MTSASSAIRSAVRAYLAKLEAGDHVIVAVSGGADSLALAAAIVKEAPEFILTVIGVTIDHQLQNGSAEQAAKVASQLTSLGITDVIIEKVNVNSQSGIEAGARDARYEALNSAAEKKRARVVFLGHTRDDQAETVLLGLARGSGARSMSGMTDVNGIFIRPLLAITRSQTEEACREFNVEPWSDPHNLNQEFTRVRVRTEVLPVMEENLGPGISAALARSAELLRDDADALDALAELEWKKINPLDLDCSFLEALPRAIRTRILKRAIYEAGAHPGTLSADHVASVESLVTSWRGQGRVSLPGGVKVERISGRLSLLAQP